MPPELPAAAYTAAPSAERRGVRSFAVPVEPVIEDGDSVWLLSFADLVTLLLTVFVLLFAYNRISPTSTRRAPVAPAPAQRTAPKQAAQRAAVPPITHHTGTHAAAPRPTTASHRGRAHTGVEPPTASPTSHTSNPPLPAAAARPAGAPQVRMPRIPGLGWQPGLAYPLIAAITPSLRPPYARPLRPLPARAAPRPTTHPRHPASKGDRHATRARRVRAVSISIPKDLQGKVDVVRSATAVNLIITDDLLYPAGAARLGTAGRSLLDRIASMLKRTRYGISVEGYTDNTPIHTARFPSNWELSTARATTVARYLITRGVSPDRLSAVGYGDTRPRASNASAAGRALNRRVVLVLHVTIPPVAGVVAPAPPGHGASHSSYPKPAIGGK